MPFCLVAKRGWGGGGGMVPGVPSEEWKLGMRMRQDALVLALREQRNVQNVFCDESFGKNHALHVHLTCKDVDRFRNGTVHELS